MAARLVDPYLAVVLRLLLRKAAIGSDVRIVRRSLLKLVLIVLVDEAWPLGGVTGVLLDEDRRFLEQGFYLAASRVFLWRDRPLSQLLVDLLHGPRVIAHFVKAILAHLAFNDAGASPRLGIRAATSLRHRADEGVAPLGGGLALTAYRGVHHRHVLHRGCVGEVVHVRCIEGGLVLRVLVDIFERFLLDLFHLCLLYLFKQSTAIQICLLLVEVAIVGHLVGVALDRGQAHNAASGARVLLVGGVGHCLERGELVPTISNLIAPEGRLATQLLTVDTVHEYARYLWRWTLVHDLVALSAALLIEGASEAPVRYVGGVCLLDPLSALQDTRAVLVARAISRFLT